MNDDFFFDSNILLYLLNDGLPEKKAKTKRLMEQGGSITPQVLFECLNVATRKFKLDKKQALTFVQALSETLQLQSETSEVVEKAFTLFGKYFLQPFDSKIVASALVAGCTTLYSEDMQHGLVIENTLTIVNPFL